MHQYCKRLLKERGVELKDIADIVYELQIVYNLSLKMEDCMESIEAVIKKREVQHAIITGISLDILAEKKQLPPLLQEIIEKDEPLYGLDEIMALSITNIYGTIGLTSFGYLDKNKMGILKYLNNHDEEIHVFLDDIVAGIAAAASSRIAHKLLEDPIEDNY